MQSSSFSSHDFLISSRTQALFLEALQSTVWGKPCGKALVSWNGFCIQSLSCLCGGSSQVARWSRRKLSSLWRIHSEWLEPCLSKSLSLTGQSCIQLVILSSGSLTSLWNEDSGRILLSTWSKLDRSEKDEGKESFAFHICDFSLSKYDLASQVLS